MNALVFTMLVACATAQYWPYNGYYGRFAAPYAAAPYTWAAPAATPYTVAAAPVATMAAPVATWAAPMTSASQYHAQDELGQASFGYAYPGQAASNVRDAFGNQIGSYAYINPEGKEVKVSYTADSNGFRVLSNDLPVAPVFEGKAPVFDGVAPVFDGKAPEPVDDTAEVVAAKSEFFKLYKEAEEAAAAAPERKKRQVLALPYEALEHPQYPADFVYSSTDLNRDGQPDNKQMVIAAPVASYAYSGLPYAYSGFSYNYGYPYLY